MYDIVPCNSHLVDQHIVHFFPVFIQGIIFHSDQHILLKLRTADAFIMDNDLHLYFRSKASNKLRIFTKDRSLLIHGFNGEVNIREGIHPRIPSRRNLYDPVLIRSKVWDGILHSLWDPCRFFRSFLRIVQP